MVLNKKYQRNVLRKVVSQTNNQFAADEKTEAGLDCASNTLLPPSQADTKINTVEVEGFTIVDQRLPYANVQDREITVLEALDTTCQDPSESMKNPSETQSLELSFHVQDVPDSVLSCLETEHEIALSDSNLELKRSTVRCPNLCNDNMRVHLSTSSSSTKYLSVNASQSRLFNSVQVETVQTDHFNESKDEGEVIVECNENFETDSCNPKGEEMFHIGRFDFRRVLDDDLGSVSSSLSLDQLHHSIPILEEVPDDANVEPILDLGAHSTSLPHLNNTGLEVAILENSGSAADVSFSPTHLACKVALEENVANSQQAPILFPKDMKREIVDAAIFQVLNEFKSHKAVVFAFLFMTIVLIFCSNRRLYDQQLPLRKQSLENNLVPAMIDNATTDGIFFANHFVHEVANHNVCTNTVENMYKKETEFSGEENFFEVFSNYTASNNDTMYIQDAKEWSEVNVLSPIIVLPMSHLACAFVNSETNREANQLLYRLPGDEMGFTQRFSSTMHLCKEFLLSEITKILIQYFSIGFVRAITSVVVAIASLFFAFFWGQKKGLCSHKRPKLRARRQPVDVARFVKVWKLLNQPGTLQRTGRTSRYLKEAEPTEIIAPYVQYTAQDLKRILADVFGVLCQQQLPKADLIILINTHYRNFLSKLRKNEITDLLLIMGHSVRLHTKKDAMIDIAIKNGF